MRDDGRWMRDEGHFFKTYARGMQGGLIKLHKFCGIGWAKFLEI